MHTLIKTALVSAFCLSAQSLAFGADIAHGKELVTSGAAPCTSCHGSNFNNPTDPSFPVLAGQVPDYLIHALTAYKMGTNPLMGRNNAIMAGQVSKLSDRDIDDIAAYLASLPGPLVQEK